MSELQVDVANEGTMEGFPGTPFMDSSFAGSRRKVDELFMHWLSLPGTQSLLLRVADDVKAGKSVDLNVSGSSWSSLSGPGAAGRKMVSPLPRSPTRHIFSYGFASPPMEAAPEGFPTGVRAGDARGAVASPGAVRVSPGKRGAELTARRDLGERMRAAGEGGEEAAPQEGRKEQEDGEETKEAVGAATSVAAADVGVGAGAGASSPSLAALTGKKVPRFFFPHARRAARFPPPPELQLEANKELIDSQFEDAGERGVCLAKFAKLAKLACRFPAFFARPVFKRVLAVNGRDPEVEMRDAGEGKIGDGKRDEAESKTGAGPYISKQEFLKFWESELEDFDLSDRLFRLIKPLDRSYIVPQDFYPFLDELLLYHPGLEFLEATPEFQEKYSRTVITRIFYVADRSRTGRLSAMDLRRARLAEALTHADEEEDINLVNAYFSYEHFYVLYCKFWELDTDHNFVIDKTDLARHGGHALSKIAIDRVFECLPYAPDCSLKPEPLPARDEEDGEGEGAAGKPEMPWQDARRAARAAMRRRRLEHKMIYEEFCYFLLSEEDKTNPISIRFWFRCADIDGDGFIRLHELRHFYNEQATRQENLRHEVIPFEDVVCQMFDMLKPTDPRAISVRDFLQPDRIKVSGVFFDVLFSLPKLFAFEQRDPFQLKQQRMEPELTAWDRYARLEYARLAMEEECREEELSVEMDRFGGALDEAAVFENGDEDGVSSW